MPVRCTGERRSGAFAPLLLVDLAGEKPPARWVPIDLLAGLGSVPPGASGAAVGMPRSSQSFFRLVPGGQPGGGRCRAAPASTLLSLLIIWR